MAFRMPDNYNNGRRNKIRQGVRLSKSELQFMWDKPQSLPSWLDRHCHTCSSMMPTMALLGAVFVWSLDILEDFGAFAQQVRLGVTNSSVSEGFFEYQGASWTLLGPSGFARFGRPHTQVSPFPAFQTPPPSAGIHYGSRKWQGEFFGYWSHGIQRNHQTVRLSETLSDGIYGSLACQSLTPFVIGFHPVFASAPNAPSVESSALPFQFVPNPKTALANNTQLSAAQPLQRREKIPSTENAKPLAPVEDEPPLVLGRRLRSPEKADSSGRDTSVRESQSSAERVVMSVDEAQAIRAAEQERSNQEAERYCNLAEVAMKCGQQGQAKIYLRLAEKLASGDVLRKILQLRQNLDGAGE